MSQTEYTSISVRKSDKEAFEQTLDAVAAEIGEEPSQSDALREISEAYVGGNACGGWREDE